MDGQNLIPDQTSVITASSRHLTPIELLPVEMLLRIGTFMPVESRVALSLASPTLLAKLSDTFHSDDLHDEDEVDQQGSGSLVPPPTPRMCLLELLEFDTLPMLQMRCGYCRTLHPVPWPSENDNSNDNTKSNDMADKNKDKDDDDNDNDENEVDEADDNDSTSDNDESEEDVDDPLLCTTPAHTVPWLDNTTTIALPFVRAAVQLASRPLNDDDGSFLQSLLASISRTATLALPASRFTYRVSHDARVVNGRLLLRKQVLIARTTAMASPSARDLAALDHILSINALSMSVPYLGNDLSRLRDLRTSEFYASAHDDAAPAERYRWYRDDVGPSREALTPRVRCLLTHLVPCRECAKKDGFLGRVDGSRCRFMDYCLTSVKVAGNQWGRVLVLAAWRDLGAGAWPGDARWRARPGARYYIQGFREAHGSRVGDVYEAFEGVEQGTPYEPQISGRVVEQLNSPRRARAAAKKTFKIADLPYGCP